jgi:membrane protein DedA with SNARE-associated domain
MGIADLIQHSLQTEPGVIAGAAGLFLAPFVHENISIVTAAILVAGHQLPRWIALASLYGGMTTSDLALYGVGALARRNRRAQRFFIGRGNDRLNALMRANMDLTVIGARFVPGMIFPSYVACGWVGLPFRRFFVLCLASAALYLPLAFALAQAFGEATTRFFGYWAWAGLILPLLAAGFIGSRLLARGPTPQAAASEGTSTAAAEQAAPSQDLAGEILLPDSRRPYSPFEFWPGFIFYAPVYLYYAWQALRHRSLTLPALANPAMENGGLWGESKRELFDSMGEPARRWLAPYTSLTRAADGDAAQDAEKVLARCQPLGIGFPFVAKPDIGCQGNGVQIIADRDQLHRYLAAFPRGRDVIIQQLVDKPGEAGVFYIRHPGEAHGRITSLTLKIAPRVMGDGFSTIEQLVRADRRAGRIAALYRKQLGPDAAKIPAKGEEVRLVFVGNHCKGSIFRDGGRLITPLLTRWIDEVARGIPDFYFGRFDLRFASLGGLQAAEDLTLIEYNGSGSEPTHIWDADMTLLSAYADLFGQMRAMFAIGKENRRRGHKAERWDRILLALWQQSRLMKRYPAHQ